MLAVHPPWLAHALDPLLRLSPITEWVSGQKNSLNTNGREAWEGGRGLPVASSSTLSCCSGPLPLQQFTAQLGFGRTCVLRCRSQDSTFGVLLRIYHVVTLLQFNA